MIKFVKWTIITLFTAILIIALAGMYKFNYLANKEGYDPDGNKIEQENNKMETVESFKIIDDFVVNDLNKRIALKNLNTFESVVNLYKPKHNEVEGNYSYTISEKRIDAQTNKVVFIELGLPDDSVAGEKTVMIIKSENEKLSVISIKENFKCQQNRGHSNWGIELCK